jgi:3-hydroxyisobutyrate dehydrogenase
LGWIKALSAAAAARGVSFLDAPVVGSRPQAEAAQLIFLAGGDPGVVARAEPVLKVMGIAVHHVGPNGAGAAMKLGINALFGIQVAALAELLALLRLRGVSPARAAEIISSTPVASPAAKGAAQSIVPSRVLSGVTMPTQLESCFQGCHWLWIISAGGLEG